MKIYYFTNGGFSTGSARCRAYRIAKYLNDMRGVESAFSRDEPYTHTWRGSFGPLDADIVIYQKQQEPVDIARKARAKGVKVIFDMSDLMGSKFIDIINLADALTANTKGVLQSSLDQTNNKVKTRILRDIVDYLYKPLPARIHTKTSNLKIVFQARPENLGTIRLARDALIRLKKKMDYEFTYISGISVKKPLFEQLDPRWIQWKYDTFSEEMQKYDIAIAPNTIMTKGRVKVKDAVTHNLAVVSSKYPANWSLAVDTKTEEFCCANPDEWYNALMKMIDPKVRNDYMSKVLPYMWKEHSVETIGTRWYELFKELLDR